MYIMPKKKKEKKENLKTIEERISEIIEIKKKLSEIGLTDQIEGIKEFYKYCNDFVKYNYSWTGKIKLYGTKRILEATLPRTKNIKCMINLKYDENI